MRDLLVIVPSRGRPEKAAELYSVIAATSQAQTDLFLAYDDDDPAARHYRALAHSGWRTSRNGECRLWSVSGPRQGLAAWTNQIAVGEVTRYRAVCSMGDDHRPRTAGWDAMLLGALGKTGGTGIAYGDDWLQGERVPTVPVISSDIVTALGWMCLPSLRHYYVDDVWKFLGQNAGCLHYVPDVVIEHLHPLATGEPPDSTYKDAAPSYQADRAAFTGWRNAAAAADVAVITRLLPVAAR